jgi:hypothetical protein
MRCDIRFDYVHPHRGERWYRCNACGATDWFGRNYKPTTLDSCVDTQIDALDQNTKSLIVQAYKRGYRDAMQQVQNTATGHPDATVEQALRQ